MNRPRLEIALVGDSLSTSFYAGNTPGMLWRAHLCRGRNWFLDETGKIDSVVTRLRQNWDVIPFHLARVSARVDHPSERRKILHYFTGIVSLSGQLARIFRLPRLPDCILLWIGHHNVDWARRLPGAGSEMKLLTRVASQFRLNYKANLANLLERAKLENRRISVCVFGLINFTAFFTAREAMEQARKKDPALYTSLESAFRTFPSMRFEHRANMITLSKMMNFHLEGLIAEFAASLQGTPIRLFYSDAFATAPLTGPDNYSQWDAWHPSKLGHKRLASAAWEHLSPYLADVLSEIPKA